MYCPNCKQVVNPRATVCLFCGASLATTAAEVKPVATKQRFGFVHRLWFKIALVVLVAVILLAGVGLAMKAAINARDNDSSSNAKATNSSATATKTDTSTLGADGETTSLRTPCYVATFDAALKVTGSATSCDLTAFDGDTAQDSSDIYQVVATAKEVSQADFNDLAKAKLTEATGQLTDFTVSEQGAGTFAGSPAYIMTGKTADDSLYIHAVAVLHETDTDNNVFVIVRASSDSSVDVKSLEQGWSWR